MKISKSFEVLWTDDGRPANDGRFDGAGRMNDLLMCLFTGKEDWQKVGMPFSFDVMDKVTYETKFKVTVTLEEIEELNEKVMELARDTTETIIEVIRLDKKKLKEKLIKDIKDMQGFNYWTESVHKIDVIKTIEKTMGDKK